MSKTLNLSDLEHPALVIMLQALKKEWSFPISQYATMVEVSTLTVDSILKKLEPKRQKDNL